VGGKSSAGAAGQASTGGGGASSAGSAGSAAGAPAQPTGPAVVVSSLEVAQTHVLPEGGRSWKLAGKDHELHVIGARALLAMVALEGAVKSPSLEVWVGDTKVGAVPLADPSALPKTEAGGPAYAEDLHSATVPAAWVKPGLRVRVTSADRAPSAHRAIKVGADSDFVMHTLPFYLFGADPTNSLPLSKSAKPDQASQDELFAKWPVASVKFVTHPAGRVEWPTLVSGPHGGSPARRLENSDQQRDGYDAMRATLNTLSVLRAVNGNNHTNTQIYAPLMMRSASGKFTEPGGGLGGGARGTGTASYTGIFIHEQGHAFGLPHAGGAYADGEYPYVGGSLKGSAWAYDAGRGELLAPFVPAGAETAKSCATDGTHQKDAKGRCVKQDPMQSGSGDQAPGYKYTAFSDFNAGAIQRWFEGTTSVAKDGAHEYEDGVVFVDASSATGYSRWDAVDGARVPVERATRDKGLWGFDGNLPYARDVPVHTVIFTVSAAGTPGASQIYPTLSYVGNLVREVDPTRKADLAEIAPGTGESPWYCSGSGCDYTVRVTYADGSRAHVLVRGGFRGWFKPTSPLPASSTDPTDDDSFAVFGVSVPGDKPLAKVEVLETPMGWGGLPANPKVLMSR
ncbi:MAG: peptidase M66, partial [Polyangiaceae bacterium]|nr:peptidase M66 [Polyangiaceae bacterium]